MSAAFEALSDADKRKLYDEFGEDGLRAGFNPDEARAYTQWQKRAQSAGGFNRQRVSAEDIFGASGFDFGDIFGGYTQGGSFGGNWSHAPRRGSDVRASMTVDLKDVVLGTKKEINFDRPATCQPCQGTGMQNGSQGQACSNCGGYGQTNKSVRLTVTVPQGIESGHVMRLAGQGTAGSENGTPGDLLIDITVRPHPLIERKGRDLYLALPVTLKEALMGARVSVPTFQGEISLTIPTRSQNGQKLRVKGRGIAGRPKGDLYVVLDVRLPTRLGKDDELRPMLEALDGMYDTNVRASLAI